MRGLLNGVLVRHENWMAGMPQRCFILLINSYAWLRALHIFLFLSFCAMVVEASCPCALLRIATTRLTAAF